MRKYSWAVVPVLALVFQCLFHTSALPWSSSSGNNEGHKTIAEDATTQMGSDYPDMLTNLRTQVVNGAYAQGMAYEDQHLNDGNQVTTTEYWSIDSDGTAGKYADFWINGKEAGAGQAKVVEGVICYRESNGRGTALQTAYRDFGRGIHLIQDAQVPAHQKYCPHGVFATVLGVPTSWHADGLESSTNANWGYKATGTTGFTFVLNNVTYTYWLSDAEDDDDNDGTTNDNHNGANDATTDDRGNFGVPNNYCHVGNGQWGTYGYVPGNNLPGNSNCDDQGDQFDEQIAAGDNRANAINILQEHLYSARTTTEDRLKEISKKLPPLPTDINVSCPDHKFTIENKNTTISFKVWDNRKNANDCKVKVTVMVGGEVIKDLDGHDWDQREITLDANSTTGQLPFEKDVSFQWDGKKVDEENGTWFSAGTYHIEIITTDEEDTPNSCSSDTADPSDADRSYVVLVQPEN